MGHSPCCIDVPSGQNNRNEPHHSSPSAGRRPQSSGSGLVEKRDPAGGVRRVDRDAEGFEEGPIALLAQGAGRGVVARHYRLDQTQERVRAAGPPGLRASSVIRGV